MGYERSAWIALLVILLVESQDAIMAPVEPDVCAGSRCSSNSCDLIGFSCCQCEATVKSRPVRVEEICACCPAGYSCCPSTSRPLERKCCPAGWQCNPDTGGCTRLTSSIPPTVVSSKCDLMKLFITADAAIDDLFLDGISYLAALSTPNAWDNVRTIEIPANTKVIATKCSYAQKVVAAGLLASTTNDYLLTSTAWKCTDQSNLPENWMQATFDDYSPPNDWPNAVFQDFNVASNVHGFLPPISPSAAWIWTQNYRRPTIDTPVHCRGYFPTADCIAVNSGCNFAYGNCSNLCSRERKGTSCGCEWGISGPSMVCNCCPEGYKCCGMSRCCPNNSTCQLDGQCLEVFSPVSSVGRRNRCIVWGGNAPPPVYDIEVEYGY